MRDGLSEPIFSGFFYHLIEHSPDAVIVHEAGICRYANLAAARIFALPRPADLLGRSLWQGIHPDSVSVIRERIGALVSGQPLGHMTVKLQRTGLQEAFMADLFSTTTQVQGVTYIVSQIRDVTDHEAIQTALRQSEEAHRHLVELCPDAILVHDGKTILFANSAAEQILGGALRQRLTGKLLHSFVHPEELPFVVRRIQAMVTSGQTAPAAVERLIRLDGQIINAKVRGTPSTYLGKRAYILVAEDITEELRVKAQLEESEQRHRSLFENMPEAVYMLDLEGHLRHMNRACERLIEAASEAAVSRSYLSYIYPDDQPNVMAQFRRAVGGETVAYSARLMSKTGNLRYVEVSNTPAVVDGEIIGVHGIARDVTERVLARKALSEAEESTQAILDNSPAAIYVRDTDGRYLQVNQRFEQVTGRDRQSILGKTPHDLFPAKAAAVIREAHGAVLRAGEAVTVEERLGEGETTQAYVTVQFPLRDREGQIYAVCGISTDITEQERMRQRVLESEQRFKSLFENHTDLVYQFDNDLNMVGANPAMERVLGHTLHELQGMRYREWYVGSPEAAPYERHLAALRGHPTAYEIQVLDKQGEVHDLAVTDIPIVVDGRPQGLYCVAREITEFNRIQRRLAETEQRLRSVITNTPILLFSMDARGVITFSDGKVLEAMGHQPGGTVGTSIFDLYPDAPAVLEAASRALRGQSATATYGVRGVILDERFIPVFGEHGEVTSVVGVAVDVTERAQAETLRKVATEKLAKVSRQNEMLLQSIGEGICGLDTNGHITFANPAACKLLGYQAEEMIGRHWLDVVSIPSDPNREEKRALLGQTQGGTSASGRSDLYFRGSTYTIPVELHCTPILEADQVTGKVVAFRDISERLVIDRMKDEFISVVSHELRTPLTSIRGSLGLLSSGVMGPLPEKGRRMLEIGVSNTDRLIRLINEILDLERIASGQIRMDQRSTAADAIVAQAVAEMQGLATQSQVQLLSEADPVMVEADPDRLIQVLTNLIANAIKFSEPGKRVWVTAKQTGAEVLLEVRDQGRGIPADKLQLIFGRFQQVDASDSRQKGGAGLGLAIAKSIVEQHGGRIWVNSEVGLGSTFFVTLPASWVPEGPKPIGPRCPQP